MARGSPQRLVAIFLGTALGGALATVILTTLFSLTVGQKMVVIDSSSMEPALSEGDLVVEREIHPAEANVGDIITFSEPGTGRTTTHRVRALRPRGGRVAFVTQGDSSGTVERFSVPADGEIGVAVRRVPVLGTVWDSLGGPLSLLIVPLLALGGYVVFRRLKEARGGVR